MFLNCNRLCIVAISHKYNRLLRRNEQPHMFPVIMTERTHLFPYRTQKLSSPVPMILGWRRPGKVGHCRIYIPQYPVGRACGCSGVVGSSQLEARTVSYINIKRFFMYKCAKCLTINDYDKILITTCSKNDLSWSVVVLLGLFRRLYESRIY